MCYNTNWWTEGIPLVVDWLPLSARRLNIRGKQKLPMRLYCHWNCWLKKILSKANFFFYYISSISCGYSALVKIVLIPRKSFYVACFNILMIINPSNGPNVWDTSAAIFQYSSAMDGVRPVTFVVICRSGASHHIRLML